MADPTPTREQVLAAITAALAGNVSATVLHFENRRKSELELLREYQNQTSYEVELLLLDADVDSVEGKTYGEKYSIYKVELRHLYTTQDEEEIARIAKYRAEKIRGLLEGNAAVFRIGAQVPLRTPETVELRGAFVEREDSRYYESFLNLQVEARRWS